MLERDRARFAFAAAQAAPSPLGAGALAGSTLPLPPPPNPMRNSLDAVADRDFALDYLYAAAVLFTHLSRIGEELVLWTTAEFGFARLPEDAATGSSMMPQKLNPDVAELARGKAGTAIGRLTGLLATVKGLPLAYDRDLQEDKPPVFAARRDVAGALGALAVLVGGLEFDRDRLAAAASDPLLLATDAAEALVREGVPFRDAHEQVAGSVRDGTFEPPPPAPRLPRRRRSRRESEDTMVVMSSPLAVDLAGRDLLRPSDLVPAESEAVLDLAAGAEGETAARAAAAGPDARSPLLQALDAHARLVRGRDDAARRRGDPARAGARCSCRAASRCTTPREVLSRYLDAIAIRTYAHAELEAWAEACVDPDRSTRSPTSSIRARRSPTC